MQGSDGLIIHHSKPLIQLYLDQYILNDSSFVYEPFHPSFDLIAELIQRQFQPFSLRELELLITLVQQLRITNTQEYHSTLKQVQEWKAKSHNESLFVNMKLEKWEEKDTLTDTFLGCSFSRNSLVPSMATNLPFTNC